MLVHRLYFGKFALVLEICRTAYLIIVSFGKPLHFSARFSQILSCFIFGAIGQPTQEDCQDQQFHVVRISTTLNDVRLRTLMIDAQMAMDSVVSPLR